MERAGRIELLAPAKNADIGKAAIQCGADAVYISALKFGAREQAGNSVSDIETLAAYAHRFYARVYVALNTILTDAELVEAAALVWQLYEVGIDGLIIQDVGLLEVELPPVPLFASTQMHNDSLEKVQFLEKVGFSRVILPREMSIPEIRAIADETNVALECFVHGALCVSYSGQCYFSYAIGKRSGNRGCCAQPCRRQYTLIDAEGRVLAHNKYLLSLKDMNRSAYLEALYDAGVRSFKIEGRLKDSVYVKNTVSFYRRKLDALLAGKKGKKSSSGTATCSFIPNPAKTFNRGFTDFGMNGTFQAIASHNTPKSLGEEIGAVCTVEENSITLTASHDLTNGDGICFFDVKQLLRGTMVNRVDGGRVYPAKMTGLRKGIVLYRNHDHAFIKELSKKKCERKIGVCFIVREDESSFILHAIDEDGIEARFSLRAKKMPAEKKEQSQETFVRQLKKLNETDFMCMQITFDLAKTYFLPVSHINELRRGAIDALVLAREKQRVRWQGGVHGNTVPYPDKEITYQGNCLNEKAVAFYARHGTTVVEFAAESGLLMQGRMLMRSKYCLKQSLSLCGRETGPLFLVDEYGGRCPLSFDCNACTMTVFAS